MRLTVASCLAITGSALAIWACATAVVPVDFTDLPEAGNPDSGLVSGDAGCPQYNINTDPKHCGSCTKGCTDLQVCSNGACKGACDLPTVKCAADGGGSGCVNLTTDPMHCGSCNIACSIGDAGGLTPGNNNPDSGIPFDGGYDGGIGWTNGTPTCAASKCGLNCPPGTTACSDNICYDTQNFHDHCGDCNTACATDTEWCTGGKCCPVGQANCAGTCIDVLGDPKNCGGCGIVCPNNAPNCGNGVCGSGHIYTETFTQGVNPVQQCNDWKTFVATLGNSYSSVTYKGSLDPVGYTCNNPAVASGLAQALKNGTTYTGVSCNGHVWTNCNRYGDEMWIDPPSTCSGANCPNPGYMLRACFGSANFWGGVKANTCGAPTETITLAFQ